MTHLESLLKKFDEECLKFRTTDGFVSEPWVKEFLTSALTDTLKLVVPEEVEDENAYNEGWNACREEMLERIKKLGVEV